MLSDPAISGPVVSGGEVFVATATHLVALRTSDGKRLWTTPIVPGAQQEGTSPATVNSSVALSVANGRLYVLAKRQLTPGDSTHAALWEANFYAIATADGTHIWRDSVENHPWGAAFTPIVAAGIAYVQWGPGLTAITLSGSTPEQVWRFIPEGASAQANEALTGAVLASGIVYTTDLFGVDYHQDGIGTVLGTFTYAIRASDGREIWRTPTDGGLEAQTPVVASGLVFCPAGRVLRVLGVADGHPMWVASTYGAQITAAPIVGG